MRRKEEKEGEKKERKKRERDRRERASGRVRAGERFTWAVRADDVRQSGYIGRIVTDNFGYPHVGAQKAGDHVPGEAHLPLHACFAGIR